MELTPEQYREHIKSHLAENLEGFNNLTPEEQWDLVDLRVRVDIHASKTIEGFSRALGDDSGRYRELWQKAGGIIHLVGPPGDFEW